MKTCRQISISIECHESFWLNIKISAGINQKGVYLHFDDSDPTYQGINVLGFG